MSVFAIAGSTTSRSAPGGDPRARSARAIGVSGIALLLALGSSATLLSGCASRTTERQQRGAAAVETDEAELRRKIAAIRSAILARSAAGIVADATADYQFTGPDGVSFDRQGFIARTEALFARVEAIHSLETQVDTVKVVGDRAEIELTQTMARRERPAGGGEPITLWLRYRERHQWLKTAAGWRVQQVSFLGTPERRVLAADSVP